MANSWQLRGVEKELTSDMLKTAIPFSQLAKKYGVTRQALCDFCHKKGIKRPKREHTENCSICQSIIRISKRTRSDFISSQTMKEQLKIGSKEWGYHIRILRKNGLVSQRFGRLHSKKVELAYQIYFKKRLPVSIIGRQAGLRNFHVTIRDHKASGWDVPDPLFTYDETARRIRSRMIKRRKRSSSGGQEGIKTKDGRGQMKNRGVTLTEVVLVMVIIAIAAVFVAPNIGAWIPN